MPEFIDKNFLIALTSAVGTFVVILAIALPLLKHREKKKAGKSRKTARKLQPWGRHKKPYRILRSILRYIPRQVFILLLLFGGIGIMQSSVFNKGDDYASQSQYGDRQESNPKPYRYKRYEGGIRQDSYSKTYSKNGQAHNHQNNNVFPCPAPYIIDGDTFDCHSKRVRLHGIDAPEMPEHCRPGRRCTKGDPYAAKNYLQSLTGKAVTCRHIETDHYGRSIARCTAAGKDLSCAMIAAGYAVRRYGHISCP